MSTPQAMEGARTGEPAGGEYLTFALGSEHYGVDILRVREIRGLDAVTRLPEAPPWVLGVINLRGAVIPVVDLRRKLGLPEVEHGEFTVMIVLDVDGRTVGAVVDGVEDVVRLTPDQIRPPPELDGVPEGAGICAIGADGERLLLLVDIRRTLAADAPGVGDAETEIQDEAAPAGAED